MKRLKKELPEKEYGKPEGAMRALRKKNFGPGTDGSEVLRRVLRHSPLPKTAYELCEELTYIFNRLISEKKARKEIGIRAESVRLNGLKCFDNFPATSEKRMEEMTDYFIGRQTGGYSMSDICFNVYLLILKDILCSEVGLKYDRLLPRKIPESQTYLQIDLKMFS